jgi:hypothetical protein
VVDGLNLLTGSTNGHTARSCRTTSSHSRDPLAAAETRAISDLDHDATLKQMAAQRKD